MADDLDQMTPEEIEKLYSRVTAYKTAPKVSQTTGDDISFLDRFKVKTFGGDTADTVAYLTNKYPELEVKVINNQVVARKQGEQTFHPLDPEGLDWEDVTDVIGDTAIGALEGVGTAVGGLTGLATPIPGGAYLGAMTGGGASGAALEALRQKVGQGLGVRQGDVDWGDVKFQGGIGALTGGLFGGGATKAAISNFAKETPAAAKLYARATQGATIPEKIGPNEIAILEDYIASTQEGVLPKALRLGAETLSGVPSDALRTASNDIKRVAKLEAQGAVRTFAEETSENVVQAIETNLAKASDELGTALAESGARIKTDDVLAPWYESVGKLQKLADDGLSIEDDIAALQNAFNDLPIIRDGVPLDEIDPSQAMYTAQKLLDFAKDIKSGRHVINETKNVSAAEIARAAKQSAKVLTDLIDEAIGPQYRKEWKDLKDFERFFQPKFKDATTAQRTLMQAKNKSRRQLLDEFARFDRRFGTNLTQRVNDVKAFQLWNEPSLSARSGKESTSTSRTGAAGFVGAEGGQVLADMTGASPMAKKVARIAGGLGLQTAMSPAVLREYFSAVGKIPQQIKPSHWGAKVGVGSTAVPASAWEYVTQINQGEK